jgi:hypothetical protein
MQRGGIGINDCDRENRLLDIHLPFSFLASGYSCCGYGFRDEGREPA